MTHGVGAEQGLSPPGAASVRGARLRRAAPAPLKEPDTPPASLPRNCCAEGGWQRAADLIQDRLPFAGRASRLGRYGSQRLILPAWQAEAYGHLSILRPEINRVAMSDWTIR